MCFWPASIRKKILKFLTCVQFLDLELKCCSHTIGANWMHFSFFYRVGEYSWNVIWIEFFSPVYHVLGWHFLVSGFHLNVCNFGFQNWFDHEMTGFRVFCWFMARFVVAITAGTKFGGNAPLWFSFDVGRLEGFSIFILWWRLVCSSNVHEFSAMGFSIIE